MKIDAVMKINAGSKLSDPNFTFFLTGIFSVQSSPIKGSQIMAPYDEKDLGNGIWHLRDDMSNLTIEDVTTILVKSGVFRDCIWLSYQGYQNFLKQDDLIEAVRSFFNKCSPGTCKWYFPSFSYNKETVHCTALHQISLLEKFVGPSLNDFNPECDFFQQSLNLLY